jgi:hypothetical protein
MIKIYLAVFISLFIVGHKAAAQGYEVPKHYSFKSNDDYLKYEPEILKAIDFLEVTPWNEQGRKRAEAKTFVLSWIDGSPDVTITFNSELVKMAKNNPELLGSYMYAYTKYAILHKTDFEDKKAKLAGVKGLLAKYNSEPSHKPNAEVDKVEGIDKDGKLDGWIATDFNAH